ncbi:MAG: glycoside hydrolase family 127 protein [Clostridia bacterium]|nr:glycoside hydrolase family 127 protein [Clostridia bacterium]
MKNVTLLDSYEQNAFNLEKKYLKSLESDKLLKGFCEIAGIELNAEKYGGWETSAIQGHTLGHYLTAVAQAYASSSDEDFKKITDYMISVLAKCQAENGYLAAIPESHYTQLETGDTKGTWVPWYSMHKILAGLVSVYEFTENKQALEVASKLGDWVYSHTSKWTAETQKTVLNIEYGGMNDALYDLYKYTKSENHLSAAHSFDEMTLFEPLYNGEDILNGKHANTTIPKIKGALNRYLVTGEDYYLQVAKNFWDIVINNHTYITGGNSEWEHFGEPKILDGERTNCNCETCNTYNMLKLTRDLFKITGDTKYTDYYENTFINAILSSQNPETGMTTYFQPMATGYFKVYSSPYDHFWCCTGSGMENFSKLSDSIYSHNSTSLYVNRFTSSTVTWEEKGLKITQNADLPTVKFTINGSATAQIVLRVPDWTNNPTVKMNGEEIKIKVKNGLVILDREWQNGDTIEYNLPMKITVHPLHDNKNAVAFKYGPWVLSADMGTNKMETGVTGVNVTTPMEDETISDVLVIENDSIENWVKNINENLVQEDNILKFTLKGTNQKLTFLPHYKQHTNRYGIYFHLEEKGSAK